MFRAPGSGRGPTEAAWGPVPGSPWAGMLDGRREEAAYFEEALLIADSVSVMTARPGRIKRRMVVNLPRPRSVDVTTSPVFNELKREVLALIREESLRAAGEGLA